MMHGKKRKDLLSHYEFREQIALAWLDPNTYWYSRQTKVKQNKAAKRSLASQSSSDTIKTRSSTQQEPSVKRAKRDTDISLHPHTGMLKHKLNHNVQHWARPRVFPKAKCALHYWASNIDDRSQIVFCSVCEVHLCTSCFEVYHTDEDLAEKKETLCAEFIEKRKINLSLAIDSETVYR